MTGDVEQERRFLIGRARTARFLREVLPHLSPEIPQPNRPIGYIRTTYFDTDDWRFLRSADGPVSRRLRLREYAVAAERADRPVFHGMCALELKESAGRRRTKWRIVAPADVLAELLATRVELPLTWSRMIDESAAFHDVLPLLRNGALRPRVTTWYRRAILVGFDGLRVTVDDGITFCRPLAIGAPLDPAHILRVGGGPVLEVKFGGTGCPAWLTEAMEGLIEAPGFSKFRVAAAHLMASDESAADPALPHTKAIPCHARSSRPS